MYSILINLMDEEYSSNNPNYNQRVTWGNINEVLERRRGQIATWFNKVISLTHLPSGHYSNEQQWNIDSDGKNIRKNYLIERLLEANNEISAGDSIYIQLIGHAGTTQFEDFESAELSHILIHFAGHRPLIINALGSCCGEYTSAYFVDEARRSNISCRVLYNPGKAYDDDTPFLFRDYVDGTLKDFISSGPGHNNYKEVLVRPIEM